MKADGSVPSAFMAFFCDAGERRRFHLSPMGVPEEPMGMFGPHKESQACAGADC